MENQAMIELGRETDEITDYTTSGKKDFYILKELEAGQGERVQVKELSRYLSMNDIRNNRSKHLTQESIFIQVTGDYFPDLIGENGVFLVSAGLLEYLQTKVTLRNIWYNMVGLVAEHQPIGEYYLLVPEEIDGVLKENVRCSPFGTLHFFEIDQAKTGALQIFKVKGFPHLIITEKLNRIEYTGFECIRIENYFNYEGERDRLYRERLSGRIRATLIADLDRKADATGNFDLKYDLMHVLTNVVMVYQMKKELNAGLKSILDSYRGEKISLELLADRFFSFFWSWDNGRIEVADSHKAVFGITGFELKCLTELKKRIPTYPVHLQELIKKVCLESLLYCAALESKIFDAYQDIHGNQRFRLYLADETSLSMNPPLIYDYRNDWQWEVEAAAALHEFDFTNRDLREFDFSGKDLTRMTFQGCNLRRTKFTQAVLNQAQFINCELSGAIFEKSWLRGAKFSGVMLDRTNLNGADLHGAEFSGSYLQQVSLIKSDLTEAKFKNNSLFGCYFIKAKLAGAEFGVADLFQENIFRLCDLKNAKFTGETTIEDWITGCDFRNSNLTSCRFEVTTIVDSVFIKAKLNDVDFSQCERLIRCNFQYSSCFVMNLAGLTVEGCQFTGVDLSRLKIRQDVMFADCDLTGANLTGFDFGEKGYQFSNTLMATDLSNCKMIGADFSASDLTETRFDNAILTDALFTEEQLNSVCLSSTQLCEVKVVPREVSPIEADDEANSEVTPEEVVGKYETEPGVAQSTKISDYEE